MTQWIITPKTAPAIIRNCSKCGGTSLFTCSNRFRVNANGSKLDVWLIYKCSHCETTWNMDILSRVNPRQINKTLYRNFLSNDTATAMKYAYDRQILGKNKATAAFNGMEYTVKKQTLPSEELCLEIVSEYETGMRLDKLLSDELGLSRNKVQVMLEIGFITGIGFEATPKTRVKSGTMRLRFKEPLLLFV